MLSQQFCRPSSAFHIVEHFVLTIIMTTLLSCQPPPPSGYVTVLEHECQFVSVPDEDQQEPGAAAERGGTQRGGGLLHRLMVAAGIQVAHTHTHTCTYRRTHTHTYDTCMCA